MSLTAAIWVKSLTGSSGLAALAGFLVFAPTLVGPVLGALVDRAPVRTLLVATNLGMAALLLTLLTVDSAGGVWQIYAVMLAYGVSYVLTDAAEARLIVAAVPSGGLGSLNGLRMSAQEATKLLAPLLGAGLFVWVGGPAVAMLAAGALALAATFYVLVRPHHDESPARRPSPMWTEVVEGVRFLWSHALVRRPVLVAATAMFFAGLGNAAIYSVVDEALGRSPAFVGVLSSIQGAGAIIGGLVSGRLMARRGETTLATVGMAVFALGPIAQVTGWLPAVLAGSALVGVGLPWTVIAGLTAVQRRAPRPMVGRVAASANTLVFGGPALSIPLGALLVSVLDYRIPLAVAGVAGVTVAVVARTAPQRDRAPSRSDSHDPSEYQPPSTESAAPLTNPLRDESARKATA
jgi:MFS family permease